MLTPAQFRQIVDLCAPHMQTTPERQTIFDETFLPTASFRNDINWEGATNTFVTHLLRVLHEKVHRHNGEHPWRTLLVRLKARYGSDLHAYIDSFLPLIDSLQPNEPLPGLTLTLFLSYARADDEMFVRLLYNDLTSRGFNVWYDRANMPNRGLGFTQEIALAIEQADRLLLVCGPAAYQSEYVRMEWQHALKHCKPIIPVVRLGDFPPPILDQLSVNPVDAVDMRNNNEYEAEREHIVRQLKEPPRPLGQPTGVPLPKTWYIERPEAKRKVIGVLTDVGRENTVAISTINGLAGVGKSVLAAMVARDCEVRRTFPDGITLIEVGFGATPVQVQTRLGKSLGIEASEFKSDVEYNKHLLIPRLRGKRMLFILDNVWKREQVEAVQCGVDQVKFIVTTRRTALGELIGYSVRVDVLTPEEGGELIIRRAELNTSQRADCEAISRHLNGLTLAVSVAAARIKVKGMTPAAYLEELQKSGNPLRELTLDEDRFSEPNDPEQNFAAALNLSYRDLSEAEQRYFRLLGVFAADGTFDAAAAAAVWEMPEAEAAGILRTFAERELVQQDEHGRYSQHSLLRAYARALARERGELDAAAARHFDHYHSLHGNHNTNNDETRHSAIHLDFENIQAALAWATERSPERTADWASALAYYMSLHQPYSVRRAVLEQGLAAAARAEYPLGRAHVLKSLGELAIHEADYAAARGYLSAALRSFKTSGNQLGEADTLRDLGSLAMLEVDYVAAREYLSDALSLYKVIPEQVGQSHTLKSLGDLSMCEDDFATAREYYEAALCLSEAITNQLGQAHALKSLGELAIHENNYTAAQKYLNAALHLYQMISDQHGEANVLRGLGTLAMYEARYATAREYLNAALHLSKSIPDQHSQAHVLCSLGDLAMYEADYVAAQERLDAALRLYEAVSDLRGQANALRSLGALAIVENNRAAAQEYLDTALRLYRSIPDQRGQANTLLSLGELAILENDCTSARRHLDAALRLYEAVSDLHGQANALRSLGELAIVENNRATAQEYLDTALRLYQIIPDQRGQANTLLSLGELESLKADYGTARQHYTQGLALAREVHDTACQINCLIGLAHLERSQGNCEAACAQYAALLSLADSLPAYVNHPTIQDLKREAAECCGRQTTSSEQSLLETASCLQQLTDMLFAWVQTPDLNSSCAYLKLHQSELLTDAAEAALQRLVELGSDRDMLVERLELLRKARQQGIEAAYAQLEVEQRELQRLVSMINIILEADNDSTLAQLIAGIQSALLDQAVQLAEEVLLDLPLEMQERLRERLEWLRRLRGGQAS
ncbi:MAG: TIR domain-containing protein [Anaerolineae bacterium]|nr:TIR domain-containing protein [Anaerolineae bacterium]